MMMLLLIVVLPLVAGPVGLAIDCGRATYAGMSDGVFPWGMGDAPVPIPLPANLLPPLEYPALALECLCWFITNMSL